MCSTEGALTLGAPGSPPPPSLGIPIIGNPNGFHGNQVAHPIRIEPDTKSTTATSHWYDQWDPMQKAHPIQSDVLQKPNGMTIRIFSKNRISHVAHVLHHRHEKRPPGKGGLTFLPRL